MTGDVHVAVGVVEDDSGRILISRRKEGQHLGGFWEFPGGKVEAGETVREALARELEEELGILVQATEPLIQIPYQYPEKKVLLDVHRVTAHTGSASGREGQAIDWVAKTSLNSSRSLDGERSNTFQQIEFPPANKPILSAILLPFRFLITGQFKSYSELFDGCLSAVKNGFDHIQFRAPWLQTIEYLTVYNRLLRDLSEYNLCLFANSHWHEYRALPTDISCIHLNGRSLKYFSEAGSAFPGKRLSAACHNLDELKAAEQLGVEFAFYSPVKATRSHPQAEAKGWSGLEEFCVNASVPVYALGGLGERDITKARLHGAQGVAAISAFWQ